MAFLAVLVLALSANSATAIEVYRNNGFLSNSNSMRPDMVAHMLTKVADEWKSQAHVFIMDSCKTSGSSAVCKDAPNAFAETCSKVAGAIVQGSDGVLSAAKEYMGNVCGQKSLAGWHLSACLAFSNAVTGKMSASSEVNRGNTRATAKACAGLWSEFVNKQEKEENEQKIADQKAAEKMEADAAAEAAKRAAAKAEEARQEAEAEKQAKAQADAEIATAQQKAEEEKAKVQQEAEEKMNEAAKLEKKAEETPEDEKLNETPTVPVPPVEMPADDQKEALEKAAAEKAAADAQAAEILRVRAANMKAAEDALKAAEDALKAKEAKEKAEAKAEADAALVPDPDM